jgi:hypothetical protein
MPTIRTLSPGCSARFAEEHAPGREMARHQGARRNEVSIVGERKKAVAGHRNVVGKATMSMLAHDLDVFAERLVAGQAVAAFPAIGLGKENSLHAGLQSAAGGDLDDRAGGFDPHHLRQDVGDAAAIVAHIEIDSVDRGSRDLEHGLARGGHGIGKIAPTHAVDSTPFQNRSLHRGLLCRLEAKSNALAHDTWNRTICERCLNVTKLGVAVHFKYNTLAN